MDRCKVVGNEVRLGAWHQPVQHANQRPWHQGADEQRLLKKSHEEAPAARCVERRRHLSHAEPVGVRLTSPATGPA